jgi:hypothetical protein
LENNIGIGFKNRVAFIWAVTAVVLVVLAVTIVTQVRQKPPDPDTGITYTHYNNFLIFRESFHHLLDNQDLYQEYPQEHYDLFKYSPTFAVLIAPIAIIPAKIGLFLWNLLNALVLFTAIWKFPSFSQKQKLLALGFILIEMITSIQNTQSNALLAGFVILGFVFLEKDKPWIATLFIILTVFTKIFGLVALAIFIFYPKKLKNSLITFFWMILLGAMPLIIISPSELINQYQSWLGILRSDASVYSGLSVMSWLYTWFGLDIGKNILIILGAILLFLPLMKFPSWSQLRFRIMFLSSILVWVVIFNHMAESPTFVIAASGIAIWFFSKEKMRWEDMVLVGLVLLFTILSPTDIFPSVIRKNLVEPYVLKAVPCIFVWFKIIYDMFLFRIKEIPV